MKRAEPRPATECYSTTPARCPNHRHRWAPFPTAGGRPIRRISYRCVSGSLVCRLGLEPPEPGSTSTPGIPAFAGGATSVSGKDVP